VAWLQGGGPYGKQVTRGQDLTGKDFSGLTLVKQDFKTVLRLHAHLTLPSLCNFLTIAIACFSM
jgi:hypothetical protein